MPKICVFLSEKLGSQRNTGQLFFFVGTGTRLHWEQPRTLFADRKVLKFQVCLGKFRPVSLGTLAQGQGVMFFMCCLVFHGFHGLHGGPAKTGRVWTGSRCTSGLVALRVFVEGNTFVQVSQKEQTRMYCACGRKKELT